MCVGGCIAFLLRLPDFVKFAGNSFLHLLSGMVLTSAIGSNLTGSDLLLEESTFLDGLGCLEGDVVDLLCKCYKVPWAVH